MDVVEGMNLEEKENTSTMYCIVEQYHPYAIATNAVVTAAIPTMDDINNDADDTADGAATFSISSGPLSVTVSLATSCPSSGPVSVFFSPSSLGTPTSTSSGISVSLLSFPIPR